MDSVDKCYPVQQKNVIIAAYELEREKPWQLGGISGPKRIINEGLMRKTDVQYWWAKDKSLITSVHGNHIGRNFITRPLYEQMGVSRTAMSKLLLDVVRIR